MIQMWAALESMSARLATLHAPDAEIGKLRHLFDEFQNSPPAEHLDEYSDANIAFHQMIIRLGGSQLIADRDQESVPARARDPQGHDLAERARRTLDHRSPENHRSPRAARHRARRAVTRQHTLDLAAHVERYCEFLD